MKISTFVKNYGFVLFCLITLKYSFVMTSKDQNISFTQKDLNMTKPSPFLSSLTKLRHHRNRKHSRPNSTETRLNNEPNLLSKLSKVGHKDTNSTQYKKSKKQIETEEIEDFDFEKLIHSTKNIDYSFDAKKQRKYPVFKPSKMDSVRSPNHRGLDQIKTIYESLKNGNLIYDDGQINTVRYIPCVKVNSNKKLNLLFNLSLISSSEKIVKAELYLNKKYIKHRLMFNLHYLLHSKNNNERDLNLFIKNFKLNKTSSASTTIDLAMFKNQKFRKYQNWHVFNLIDSLSSYVTTRNNRFKYSSIMNAKTGSNGNNKIYYTYDNVQTNLNKNKNPDLEDLVLVMESLKYRKNDFNSNQIDPYLIIYTNEEENSMKNFFQNRIPSEMLEDRTVKPTQKVDENEIERLNSYEKLVDTQNNDVKDSMEVRSDSSEIYHSNIDSSIRIFEHRPILNPSLIKSKLKNTASSLYNYIPLPSDKSKLSGLIDLNKNSKDIEIVFKEMKSLNSKKVKKDLDQRGYRGLESSNETNDNDTNLFLSWNENNWKKEMNESEIKKEKIKCQTQPITIDFEDMSFADWIIEPKSFQSSYCSGSCKFPIDKVRFILKLLSIKRKVLFF